MASTRKNSECFGLSSLSTSTTAVSLGNFKHSTRNSQVQIASITPDPALEELPWYRQWVAKQVREQPHRLLSSLPHIELDEKNEPDLTYFFRIWNQIREIVLALPPAALTIDNITDRLILDGHVTIESSYDAHHSTKELIFAILGWQTMLYKPDLYKSTPSHQPLPSNETTGYGLLSGRTSGLGGTGGYGGGYSIVDDTDGCSGCESRLSLTQHTSSAGSKRIPEFLLGFGMLLPPSNYCATFVDAGDNSDQVQAQLLFRQTRTISVKDLNVHTLTKVCGLAIEWVDSLPCHLELDTQTGRFFMFRYPSFCLSNLKQFHIRCSAENLGHHLESKDKDDDTTSKKGQRRGRTVLHNCALEKQEGPSSIPWATEEDVNALLREVLLSYRLIFGQSKKSRSVFRKLVPFPPSHNSSAKKQEDRFLEQLCGRKRFDIAAHDDGNDSSGSLTGLIEREEYDLAGDFPHLRGRLVRLNQYAAGRKPRSIRQLWGDRRDSTAWLAL